MTEAWVVFQENIMPVNGCFVGHSLPSPMKNKNACFFAGLSKNEKYHKSGCPFE